MQSELGDFLKVYIQTDSHITELGVPPKVVELQVLECQP